MDIVLRMRQQVFMPNDVLCKVGDKAKEMFIVKSGRLHVIDDAGTMIQVLMETSARKRNLQEISDGCTYGEMSIIQMKGNAFGDKRQTGLLSVGYSDVYILNQDDVLPLLSEYPDERERLSENGKIEAILFSTVFLAQSVFNKALSCTMPVYDSSHWEILRKIFLQ